MTTIVGTLTLGDGVTGARAAGKDAWIAISPMDTTFTNTGIQISRDPKLVQVNADGSWSVDVQWIGDVGYQFDAVTGSGEFIDTRYVLVPATPSVVLYAMLADLVAPQSAVYGTVTAAVAQAVAAASQALASKNSAAVSETNAATSAASANKSAVSAGTSLGAATTAAGNASGSATAAATAKAGADTSAAAAETARAAAVVARTGAEAARDAAAAHSDPLVLPAAEALVSLIHGPGIVKDELSATYVTLAGTEPITGRHRFAGAFTSRDVYVTADPAQTGGIVAKPSTDLAPGVIDWLHDSPFGYLFHLQARAGATAASRMIAIGLDHSANDGADKGAGGILIAQKANSVGFELSHYAEITGTDSYGVYLKQLSTAAPLQRMEQLAVNGAPLVEIFVGASGHNATSKSLTYVDTLGNAGFVTQADGVLHWNRNVLVADRDGTHPSMLSVQENAGVTNISPVRIYSTGVEFRSYTGSGTSYWPKRLLHAGNHLKIQGADTTTGVDTVPATWIDAMDFTFNGGVAKIGFFGTAAVAKPAALPADASDLATAIALLNYIKNSVLKAEGLAA
ncbi:hypothetical protein [Glaciihabitans sp. dw_435]|uniref:hypothetical protein n=1 Tax=Glaciihabitans sp. dw_435 TaxID=2720081 RepID=UPI001BD42586|nr:hypothetical protein [Glaciihabitans sp. dw_435]